MMASRNDNRNGLRPVRAIAGTAAALVIFGAGAWIGGSVADSRATAMAASLEKARVIGIGGVFFKAKDPKALRAWYTEHLGIEVKPYGGAEFLWREETGAKRLGATIWGLFPDKTTYFGAATNRCMINYRVDSLDLMLAQLRAAGVPVDKKVESDENGRFGWATDPEGNRIELWEPK